MDCLLAHLQIARSKTYAHMHRDVPKTFLSYGAANISYLPFDSQRLIIQKIPVIRK